MGLLRKSNFDIATGFSHIWAPFQLGIRRDPIESITDRQYQTRFISLGFKQANKSDITSECFN